MSLFEFFKCDPAGPEIKPIQFKRDRLDDIEEDLNSLKDSLKQFIDQTANSFTALRERISGLEEKSEWDPEFGDKVWFEHDYFGEMKGVFLERVFPERWSIMFKDPSRNGELRHYTADSKDVRKA